MNADCVIVGAGPAGSSLAIRLARLGANVLLLDRRAFPRPKACGDCLSPQANLLLDELGVLPRIDALNPGRLAGWRIVAPNGTWFSARFDSVTGDSRITQALSIERALLDHALLEAAAAAGVHIETGAHVTGLLAERETITGVAYRGRGKAHTARARLVVGADGLRSMIRARLGIDVPLPRVYKLSLTWHIETPAGLHVLGDGAAEAHGDAARPADGAGSFGEMHLREGGCVGVAPVDATSSNLTVVANAGRYGPEVRHNPAAFAERFISGAPALAGRIDAAQLSSRPLASGPFDRPVRTITRPGAALVGDAAGYFDPFTGQGIFQALHGAALLTSAIGQHGFTSQALSIYARAFRRALMGPRLVQRLIDAALAEPARANRWIRLLRDHPDVAAALVVVTGDLRPPTALLSPSLLISLLARNHAGRPA